LEYRFPEGPLLKLLLAHVREGSILFRNHSGEQVYHLFTSKIGRPFSDVTFNHYWKLIMTSHSVEQAYFPPSLLRTMFIEEFTR
jgi:hypothetical protein